MGKRKQSLERKKPEKKTSSKRFSNPQHREDFLSLLRASTSQKASGKT